MRVCRFRRAGRDEIGLYEDERIVPLEEASRAWGARVGERLSIPGDDVVPLLRGGALHATARRLARWLEERPDERERLSVATKDVELRAPIARPPKLLLLAGNYARHIEETGGAAVERARTFPYVFSKPPSTTINHPGAEIALPTVSPDHIDWEVELGVVIGAVARRVPEAEALEVVAGYTVVNDLSDRRFRPNPNRDERPRDGFFDWLHGKWHDGFCPMGPCVLDATEVSDPQAFRLRLEVNGVVRQDASTALQVFPVAAVIAFISSFVTLEPGDVISTGTPSGVGKASGTYLRSGDLVRASIDGIGAFENRMRAPESTSRD